MYVTFYALLYFLYTREVPRPLSTGFRSKHVIRGSPVESRVVQSLGTTGLRIARRCWTSVYFNVRLELKATLRDTLHSEPSSTPDAYSRAAVPKSIFFNRRCAGPLADCNPLQHAINLYLLDLLGYTTSSPEP